MRPAAAPPFARVRAAEGARLDARDLGDAAAHARRMVELDVAALHATWGVALGLETFVSDDAREVLVCPGSAYDARGGALVLPRAVVIQAPAFAASPHDLVLRPAGDPLSAPGCEATTGCDGERLRPGAAAEVGWVRAETCAATPLGVHVPLARLVVDTAGALHGPDFSVRRVPRRSTRPHVGHASLAASQLGWEFLLWTLPPVVRATVDTSAAGFSQRPAYAVTLIGVPALPGGIAGPFVCISDAGPESFVVELSVARAPTVPALTWIAAMTSLEATSLSWIGLEPHAGRAPDFDLAGFVSGLGPTAAARWRGALAQFRRPA